MCGRLVLGERLFGDLFLVAKAPLRRLTPGHRLEPRETPGAGPWPDDAPSRPRVLHPVSRRWHAGESGDGHTEPGPTPAGRSRTAAWRPSPIAAGESLMCRSIKTLHNFRPPATENEIRASSLQFVRKLSGFTRPSRANAPAFERAVDQVAQAVQKLLDGLVTTAPPRDRDVEAAKARARAGDRRRSAAVGSAPLPVEGRGPTS